MTGAVSVDWLVLAPALVPALGAVLVLLLDAIAPGRGSWLPLLGALLCLAGAGLAVRSSLVTDDGALTTLCRPGEPAACLWSATPAASALQAGVLLASAAALAVLSDAGDGAGRRDAPVATALLLAAASGGVAVAAARDVGSWLVALELATVPAIALVALRGTRRSGHGALALLVTSLTSFALLVLGVALWVAATGDAVFAADTAAAAWADADRRAVLGLAVVALVGGLGFKLSLVPFHAWTPQAYSTADLGTALFLAAASKLSAAAALLVVVSALVGLPDPRPVVLVLAVVVVASLLLGNLVALRQHDPSRLLAWSTIAQAGWVVLPVVALTAGGVRASSAYVLVYAGATVVAFAAVALAGAPTLEGHRGLLRRDPLTGGALALALLVLAGLPPGVVGLVAKVLALRPVVDDRLWVLVAVGVVAVVLGIAVYLRWLALLLATPAPANPTDPTNPVPESTNRAIPVHRPGGQWPTKAVLVLGTVALAVLSVWPRGLLGLLG